jgi:hypothetical protein
VWGFSVGARVGAFFGILANPSSVGCQWGFITGGFSFFYRKTRI